MKIKIFILPALAASLLFFSCNRTGDTRYIDLSTGREVELVKDDSTGLWVHAETRKPVHIYVDTKTNDTIYGATGVVINGKIDRRGDGTFYYTDEVKTDVNDVNVSTDGGNGDYKIKVDGDEIKIKTDDKKIKIDEDGRKVKNDD